MPVPATLVGTTLDAMTHNIDARWTMAYAASLGDVGVDYFDTTLPEGVAAHPMFAVCPEWPVLVSGRDHSDRWGITADETRRSVHATHDLTVHRLIRPGDLLTTTGRYTGVEQRSPGAFVTTWLESRDAAGELVATTEQGALYLGVATDGDDRPAESPGDPVVLTDSGSPTDEIRIDIPHGAAHTYTECARIWNPIHTDASVARAAGLRGVILHGTATMALAVSRVTEVCAAGDPDRVRRILGRFRAQVLMPSTITVRLHAAQALPDGRRVIPYVVATDDGEPAVDRGAVVLD
jgi:acyl dehydratase